MCWVGEIEMLVWWRYKGRSNSKGAVEMERIKLCVVQGNVWHNACMMRLQPFLPVSHGPCEVLH